jgi:hypothetical protein
MRDACRDAIGGIIVEFICIIDRFELELTGPDAPPPAPKKVILELVERLTGLAVRILRGAALLHQLLTRFWF